MTYTEKTIDITTGKETFRNYTDDEVAEVEANQAQAAIKTAEQAVKNAARQNVLEKLGLSADEAKLLLS